jgi:3-oxoadipate enol-lactonase
MTERVRANGIDMAYRIDGPADGPTVVLSNSLMSDISMWDTNVSALADRYRVVRYDTRGHGGTQVTPGEYSIALLAEDLVGLSMGGMICQYAGAQFPDRVHSLTLCDTASEMPPRSMWEERLAAARDRGIAGLADSTVKRWFVDSFIEREPAQIERVRRMILGTPLDGYLGCAAAVRDMAQTTMLLKIKSPTLVLVGRQDPACTVAQATVLARMIDGAEMVVLDDAAHLSNIEKPAEFNRALRDFLDRV